MALPAGVTLVTNIKGDTGPAGTFADVTATEVAAGSDITPTITGPEDARVLHLRIPAGLPGPGGVPADEAVAAYLASATSDTRAAVYALLGWVPLASVAAAEAAQVDASVTALALSGFSDGGVGGATYVRATSEPSHPGKLQTLDGAWWEIVDATLTIEMFGGRPVPATVRDISVVEAVYDITGPFNRMSETARALGRAVRISDGHWAHSGTLTWFDGVHYAGASAGDTWRAGNVQNNSSWPTSKYAQLAGAVFVAIGTFSKSFSASGITSGEQHGYGRAIPAGERPVNNSFDERFDLWDGTNQDAAGATPATSKPFSVAHYFDGSGLRRMMVEDVTFIPNCPSPGETFGLGGYGVYSEVVPWADVDFGVYCVTPFRGYFRFQAVGYYNARGVLLTPQQPDNSFSGYGENNVFERCVIQGGLAIRTPDSWPVLSKTATTVTLRWTPSHQFAASGKLRIGVSAFTFAEYTYTAVSVSMVDKTLTFTIPGGTTDIVTTAGEAHHVWLGSGNGWANTVFRDCELFDFSHSSRINDMAPEMGARARAFSGALEISGYARALRFESTVMRVVGPLMMMIGCTRDTVFSNSWMEGRNLRRDSTSASTSAGTGSVIVAGPEPSMRTETGTYGIGDVSLDHSRNIHANVSRRPLHTPPAGSPFATMADVVTLHWRDLGEENVMRGSSDVRLWPQESRILDFRSRDANGGYLRALRTDLNGSVMLGETSGGAVRLTVPGPSVSTGVVVRAGVLPGDDGSAALGSASNRWSQVYATSGTINTSDGREKEQARPATEAEKAVAVELKGLLKAFKWTAAVEGKGDAARIHFGVIAQDVLAAFERHGLDGRDYGMLCHDEWDEQPEQFDEEGALISEYRPAGDRFGVRYEELVTFILAAI